MKGLENKRYFKRALFVSIYLALACMWLKEVTERRARQSADRFLGPTLERLEWLDDHFIAWVWRDSKGRMHGFKWLVRYEDRFMFGEPLDVEVDLLGRICVTDNEMFNSWLRLSDSDRKKEQMKQTEMEESKRHRGK